MATAENKKDTPSSDSSISSIYESSELSISSSASNRVKSYLKENGIPEWHIDKHFTFKSPAKSVNSRQERKKRHYFLPTASHSIINLNDSASDDTITNNDEDQDASSTASNTSSTDDEVSKSARLSTHHRWTRLTIQCACCGVMIIEFGWTIVECLIIPYLFLSNEMLFCMSWILFFIPLIDSWLQPSLYLLFHKYIYKHRNYYYAQLMLIVFALLFVLGFFLIPHSNIFDMEDTHKGKHKHTWYPSVGLLRIFISIAGFTIMNLSLGYLLIPLRFMMNDSMAKISSKQWFSLRKQTIDSIYNNTDVEYLSSTAEKNYISSFDALATQIYNLNEYNHYLQYSQRSIAIHQVIGRCAGYLFASIDWLSFRFIDNDWMYARKYGHIDLCFSFTCGMTIFGLCIVALFTSYVHAYAIKKQKKKKRKFYRFKSLLSNTKYNKKYTKTHTHRHHRRHHKSLDYLVPTLQSKIKFDLTRMCNINPRTRCCYFIIDGIQLHQESVQIYMDCHLNKKLSSVSRKWKSTKEKVMNGWQMISLAPQSHHTHESNMTLFGSKEGEEALSMPFELCLFWWMCFFGWLCVISFLYFFTIFVAQALSPCSMQKLQYIDDAQSNVLRSEQQKEFMDSIRYACLIMMFNAIGAGLIQLFIIERVLSINHCKTLLFASEFGISITCILFFFTHTEYHPSFVILLVTCLGFLTQLHYNLPYLLIEYKMIAIRHKETRRQYRVLSYYCSLIDGHNMDGGIANIDMTPFDSFKNSNKLMRIEQLKQHIFQRYNLAFFFALFAVSVLTGVFIIPSISDTPSTKDCMHYMSMSHYSQKYESSHHHAPPPPLPDLITTAAELSTTPYRVNVAQNAHFVFCIVAWGWISLTADLFLLVIYVIYHQCWKPYRKRKRHKKHRQQKEFDEWKLERAVRTAANTTYYYTYIESLKEKGIKTFIRDKSKTIYHNLNILKHFNKNRPILKQRASACTLKLFELKKDLRHKYKYRFGCSQSGDIISNRSSNEAESYLEYSTHSPLNKNTFACPLELLKHEDDYLQLEHTIEDVSPATLIHEITKYNNMRHVNIKIPYEYHDHHQHSNTLLLSQRNTAAQYGTFVDNLD